MTFIKFTSRILGDAVSINTNNINLGKEAYKILGEPLRVEIFYDKENKLIKIVPCKLKGFALKPNRPIQQISTKHFCKLMPIGRYRYTGKDNIFLWEDVTAKSPEERK